jgi:hypothetical protein
MKYKQLQSLDRRAVYELEKARNDDLELRIGCHVAEIADRGALVRCRDGKKLVRSQEAEKRGRVKPPGPRPERAHGRRKSGKLRMTITTVRTVRAPKMEGFVPAHFNVDSERRLITVRFDCEVTVQDVVQYLESLKANSAFAPDFSELVDLTKVMSSEVDFQAAMMLAHDVDPFSRKARRAFVAPRAATFGTVRMYQMARGERRQHRSFSYDGRS